MSRLKAPAGTLEVQSPTGTYPLDSEGCITVPNGSEDEALFIRLGFDPVNDNPARPAKAKTPPQAEA